MCVQELAGLQVFVQEVAAHAIAEDEYHVFPLLAPDGLGNRLRMLFAIFRADVETATLRQGGRQVSKV